jgi:hypothetical protein
MPMTPVKRIPAVTSMATIISMIAITVMTGM